MRRQNQGPSRVQQVPVSGYFLRCGARRPEFPAHLVRRGTAQEGWRRVRLQLRHTRQPQQLVCREVLEEEASGEASGQVKLQVGRTQQQQQHVDRCTAQCLPGYGITTIIPDG